VPVELVYAGVDRHGLHCWVAVVELGARPRALRADMIPGRTAVTIRMRGEAS
jgi:hypothetical protein